MYQVRLAREHDGLGRCPHLHRDHDHVGLMYQVRRAREHDGWLTLLEILLQRVGKLLTILHKLPLSLLQGMFTLK